MNEWKINRKKAIELSFNNLKVNLKMLHGPEGQTPKNSVVEQKAFPLAGLWNRFPIAALCTLC